jgi:Ser/Thr protein kinase RdoA (MazF antagonist)
VHAERMINRLLTAVARRALQGYALDIRRMTIMYAGWNTFYRAEAAGGRRYALRIGRPGERDLREVRSELVWLEALRSDPDLVVPEPVLTRDREPACTVIAADGTAYHCVLFTWVEGRRPPNPPSLQAVRLLGETMARLHQHADTFRPPADFTTTRLDAGWPKVKTAPIFSDEPHPLLTPQRRRFLREVAAVLQTEIDALYANPAGLRFLHADLHPGNVRVHRGRMAVLDFDDSLWCYPIQDLGISLYALERQARGEAFRRAFREGYESVRIWPEVWEGQVDRFMASRAFDLLCFFLRLEERFQPDAESTLEWLEKNLG